MIDFHQFGDDASQDDRLLMFAAPAKELDGWVGIPRKGWRVRMLYPTLDRRIPEARSHGLLEQASTPRADQPKKYSGRSHRDRQWRSSANLKLVDGQISLQYQRPFESSDELETQLAKCSAVVVDRIEESLGSGRT